jgi:hypothetical protein
MKPGRQWRAERVAERRGAGGARKQERGRQPERPRESGASRTLEQSGRSVNVAEYTRDLGRGHSNDGWTMDEQDEVLDDEFPLGDGTAETEATVLCPYCGELNQIGLDPGSGQRQEYVEDCQVCCRPWRVEVTYLPDGTAEVSVEAESPD